MIKFIFPLLFLFSTQSASALTDVFFDDGLSYTSYELTLTFDDTKQIILPSESTTTAYSIIRKEFTPISSSFQSEFTGILVGPKDKEYQRFGIPRPEKVLTGKKTVYVTGAPYHPSGERIDVYKGAQKLFSIDITGSRICIEDGVCRFDAGESEQNCQADCRDVPTPKAPVPPPTSVQNPGIPISASAPAPKAPSAGIASGEDDSQVPSMLYAFAFFVLALLSFGLWVYMKKRADGR